MCDHLPFELAIEILKRLPVKSLLRFRCVCKTWLSLISSPDFITLHLNQTASDSNNSRTQTLIKHYSDTHQKEMYSLHFDNETFDESPAGIEFPFGGYFRVVGCCNGLVCLSSDLCLSGVACPGTLILWNPSIRRSYTLPVSHCKFECVGSWRFVLGFGVDPNTNDHKVVMMKYSANGDIVPPRVEIFSLCSGNWRGMKTTSPYRIHGHFRWSQAFVKGVVHWLGYHLTKKNGVSTARSCILSFNMGSEEFGELNLPESLINVFPMSMSFAIFGGSLTVVQYNALATTCSAWVMKEYGIVDSWCNQFNIDLMGGLGLVLGLRRNGEILMATEHRGLISYNYGTGTTFNIGKCGNKNSFHVDTYSESLVLLTEGDNVLDSKASTVGPASFSSKRILPSWIE